jgi:hypothetical protein
MPGLSRAGRFLRSTRRQQAGKALPVDHNTEAAAFALVASRRTHVANGWNEHGTVDYAADGDFNGEAGEYSYGPRRFSTLRSAGRSSTAS